MSLHKLDSIYRFHGSSAVNLSWIGLVVIYQIGRGPRVDWSGENPICLGDKKLIMIADSYWGNLANSIRCSWTNMAMCPSTILEQHSILYITYCQRSPSKMIFIMIFEKKSEEIAYFFILCKLRFYCKNQQVLSPENCSSDNRMLQLILMYCRQRKWDFVFQVIWFTSYIEFCILL